MYYVFIKVYTKSLSKSMDNLNCITVQSYQLDKIEMLWNLDSIVSTMQL